MKAIILSLLTVSAAFAGPVVTSTNNATVLANTLLGSGITLVGTPTLTQSGSQSGTFTNGPALLGFSSGIVLSSGSAAAAAGNYAGPNAPSESENGGGNALLNTLSGGATFDASVLTFNFVPTSSTVFFSYVFASAEYPNFVGSFNDVFGFFVNGTNYALVPGTNIPISINNVNTTTNSAYFNKYNSNGDQLPYGGETKVLMFSAPVNVGVSNTITLGVADALDTVLDSAVFIQAGTFSVEPPTPVVPEPATMGLLGCSLAAFGGIAALRRKNRKA